MTKYLRNFLFTPPRTRPASFWGYKAVPPINTDEILKPPETNLNKTKGFMEEKHRA